MKLQKKEKDIKTSTSKTKKTYFIANWKMYKTGEEALSFLRIFVPFLKGFSNPSFVGIAPAFTAIKEVASFIKSSGLESSLNVGGQNMHEVHKGAFTGEIAATMLKDSGANFVILGHSERRRLFNETDEKVSLKVEKAIEENLIPVLCIGETLEEKQSNKTEEILKKQLEEGLKRISSKDLFFLAYEPVWAIGSGRAAEPSNVQEIHSYIRSVIADIFGKRKSSTTPILYGGSVNCNNASFFLSYPDVNGILIGGSSLNPEDFFKMIKTNVK